MADKLRFELATPTRLVVSSEVDEVVAPGEEGYFGVWPGHAPFLTSLGIGEVTYRIGRDERHLAVVGGFAEVGPDHVIVLADVAERPEEIDVAGAQRSREQAEQLLAGRGGGEIDYDAALADLNRAQVRLQVAGRASSSG